MNAVGYFAGALLAGLGLVTSFAAQAASCQATYQSDSGALRVEAVQFGAARYAATCTMLPGTTTVTCDSVVALQASDCSAPATFDGQVVVLPHVRVDGRAFTARLEWVAPSNPAQFALVSATPIGATGGTLVGSDAIAAWDALAPSEKGRITSWSSLFLHQSVGQDLEDGASANGFKPEYFGPGAAVGSTLLYGGLFEGISNGDPLAKINYFRTNALANRNTLRLAIFKFGYADIESSTLASVQTSYQALVDELKGNGIRMVHVTPPLVFDVAYNAPKMQLRQWMQATFPDDVIFDLQDIESRSGTVGPRCEQGGIWQICSDVRSTAACPSKGQGVDTAGQGHLCFSAAIKISKALLYAIYLAGQ